MNANPHSMNGYDVFVGIWNTTGKVLPIGDSAAACLIATDTYSWLPGRKFLVHHADARFDDQISRSMDVIGFDSTVGRIVARSYDDQGNTHLFDVALNHEHWRIIGDTMRFSGDFDDGFNVLSGLWELRNGDDEWRPWIELRLERDAPTAG